MLLLRYLSSSTATLDIAAPPMMMLLLLLKLAVVVVFLSWSISTIFWLFHSSKISATIILVPSFMKINHVAFKPEYLFTRFDCKIPVEIAAIDLKNLHIVYLSGQLSCTFDHLTHVSLILRLIKSEAIYTIAFDTFLSVRSSEGRFHLITNHMCRGKNYFDGSTKWVWVGKASKLLVLINLLQCLLQASIWGIIVFKEHLDLPYRVKFSLMITECCTVSVSFV